MICAKSKRPFVASTSTPELSAPRKPAAADSGLCPACQKATQQQAPRPLSPPRFRAP
jgi:hypothetical protein